MALVKVTQYLGVVNLVDEQGNPAQLRFSLVGADHATALANMQTIIPLIDAVTDALIKSYSVAERYQEDTATVGSAGSEVENIAEVSVKLEQAAGEIERFHTYKIPAASIGVFQDTTGSLKGQVDLADADVLALFDVFTDKTGYGTPGADAIALISQGEKIHPNNTLDRPTLKSGKRVHRKSRRG